MKKTIARSLVALAAWVVMAYPAFAQQYDLVINNGRVMDPETMFDSIANVGIKDGRIQAMFVDCFFVTKGASHRSSGRFHGIEYYGEFHGFFEKR